MQPNTYSSILKVILCTLPLFFLGEGGLNLQPNFQKGESLTGPQLLKGGCWKRGSDFFQVGCKDKLVLRMNNFIIFWGSIFFFFFFWGGGDFFKTKWEGGIACLKRGVWTAYRFNGGLARKRRMVLLRGEVDNSMHTMKVTSQY